MIDPTTLETLELAIDELMDAEPGSEDEQRLIALVDEYEELEEDWE